MTAEKSTETAAQNKPALPEHNSIHAAIAAAAREVRVLGKSERNKFDGYNFASIDKFLELVNPICGRNGIFPIVAQREVEFYDNVNSKGGKSVWARFFFDVTLYHSSGQSLGPVNMMVAVPMNGAQASGSAQSYALKQFFRSTLMIPTGDKDDADLNATETHQSAPPQPRSNDPWLQTILGEMPEGATDRDKAVEITRALCDQFKRMKGVRQLGNEWDRRAHLIDGERGLEGKHPDLHETVVDAYENRKNELSEG